MPDIRAMILDRLEALLPSIVGAPAATTFRNRGYLPEDSRPCMALLDGSERSYRDHVHHSSRGESVQAAQIMELRPQIYALLMARPQADANEYAVEINQYRNAIMRAVLGDSDLRTLCGPHGDVAYRGLTTDMESGRPMEGELFLDFAFYYLLDPSGI